MKIFLLFINNNTEIVMIIVSIIAFTIIGLAYNNLEIMFKVFLGVILFGVLIGIIFFLIKILSK
jgi:hypothetical protein